jgi:hypothetical protein
MQTESDGDTGQISVSTPVVEKLLVCHHCHWSHGDDRTTGPFVPFVLLIYSIEIINSYIAREYCTAYFTPFSA